MFLLPPPRLPSRRFPYLQPTWYKPRTSAYYIRPFYFYHRIVVHFTRVYLIRDSFSVDVVFAFLVPFNNVTFLEPGKGIKSAVARTTGKFVGNLYGGCKSREERRYKDTRDRR